MSASTPRSGHSGCRCRRLRAATGSDRVPSPFLMTQIELVVRPMASRSGPVIAGSTQTSPHHEYVAPDVMAVSLDVRMLALTVAMVDLRHRPGVKGARIARKSSSERPSRPLSFFRHPSTIIVRDRPGAEHRAEGASCSAFKFRRQPNFLLDMKSPRFYPGSAPGTSSTGSAPPAVEGPRKSTPQAATTASASTCVIRRRGEIF